MKIFTVMVVMVALFAFVAEAADYESITVSSAAIGFTAANIAKTTTQKEAVSAFCTLETANVRFRIDGTNPTDSEGHLFTAGASITVTGLNDLQKFRAIRVSGDATMKCSYSR